MPFDGRVLRMYEIHLQVDIVVEVPGASAGQLREIADQPNSPKSIEEYCALRGFAAPAQTRIGERVVAVRELRWCPRCNNHWSHVCDGCGCGEYDPDPRGADDWSLK